MANSHHADEISFLIPHVVSIQQSLRDSFIGAYLVGSLAIGDFDQTSDVDFIVVTKDELSGGQGAALQKVHNITFSRDLRWAKHLEYSFFPLEKLNQPSSPFNEYGRTPLELRLLWHFDHGGKFLEQSDHDNSMVVRWTLYEKSIPIIGPNPSTFMNPVAASELRVEIKNTLVGWGRELLQDASHFDNRFFQAFIPLHFCRMLQDLNEGRVTSKKEGAEWGRKNLDPQWGQLIDFALRERQDSEIHVSQPSTPTIFAEALEFVAYCIKIAESLEI